MNETLTALAKYATSNVLRMWIKDPATPPNLRAAAVTERKRRDEIKRVNGFTKAMKFNSIEAQLKGDNSEAGRAFARTWRKDHEVDS